MVNTGSLDELVYECRLYIDMYNGNNHAARYKAQSLKLCALHANLYLNYRFLASQPGVSRLNILA